MDNKCLSSHNEKYILIVKQIVLISIAVLCVNITWQRRHQKQKQKQFDEPQEIEMVDLELGQVPEVPEELKIMSVVEYEED